MRERGEALVASLGIRAFDVAKEMVRVTRRGGRIGMGNGIPNDPTLVAQILKISSAYSPPPPIERFAAAGVQGKRSMSAFAAAEANGKTPNLQEELQALFERQNRSELAGTTKIPATFLRVTVSR